MATKARDEEDDAVRARIVDVAAKLFTELGYKATKIGLVAELADVPVQTVRRLTGTRAELFRLVMKDKVSSVSAERIAAAVADPSATPPLAVVLGAAHDLYLDPARSWDELELAALARARHDPELLTLESARVSARYENVASLIRQLRQAGGVDAILDDRALTHHAMALSIGVAMLDPVITDRPTVADWDAVMARLHSAVAPEHPVPAVDFTASSRWRIRVDVPDRPGDLPRLTRALGALNAYTLAVYVVDSRGSQRTLDLALTAPTSVTVDQLLAAARAVGGNAYATEGDPDDAIDLPTRVLDGATQLLATPEWAPTGARILAEADSVEVVPATEGAETSPYVMRLQWTPNRHVVLRRTWAPFARAERTRASALLRLSTAVATVTGDDQRVGWVEDIGGETVWIRLAQPIDADAVRAMHERISDDTRYRRYVSLVHWQDVQLRRLAGGHRGASLVVVTADGDVVGLGNIIPDDSEGSHVAEVALLVEDDYQGRGVGQVLLRHLIQLARDLGFTEVVAEALADNGAVLHVLEKLGLAWSKSISDGLATWRAPLTGNPSAPSDPAPSDPAPSDPAPSDPASSDPVPG